MKWRRILPPALVFLFIASLTPFVKADTLVNGYQEKGSLQPGLIVSLVPNSSNTVQATTGNDAEHIYGVVIDPSQAPVTVQRQGQQVFVATGGTYPVLVSTQNGPIKAGDYISISRVDGIGTKASEQSIILGRALSSFDDKSGFITRASDGSAIGRINVSIMPGKNPLVKDNVAIPAPLKRFGQAIAGKNVTAVRIWAALTVFLVTAIIAISVLAVGIRSSIISIGRNPLSKKSILKGLLQVVVVAILVFIVGVFGVYLLLKA